MEDLARTVPLGKAAVAAVFVSEDWLDQARLRLFAKAIGAAKHPTGERVFVLVLLTDELTDANGTLSRQFRCSEVVNAGVRIAGTLRSKEALDAARTLRDQAMAAVADVVFDFGHIEGGSERFPGKRTWVLT